MRDGQAITIDARGLRCPLPSLRLARAVREGGPGDYVLLADDPAAGADVPALCAERGWRCAAGGGRFDVRVPAAPADEAVCDAPPRR